MGIGHEPTLFPFFSHTFFPFSHPHIYIAGILGKKGDGSPHFIYIIPIPKSKFRHVLGKDGLEAQPAKYSFVICVSLVCLGTPMGYDISIISITISITISIIYVA